MVLDDFGINLTENKGKNDTNISTVDPCTEDQPQDQTIWLTIKIAIAVIVVIGLFVIGLIIVKKRKWLRGKMMGLIGWLGHVRRSISSYPNSYGRPKDHLNEMERMPTEDNTSKENMISRS